MVNLDRFSQPGPYEDELTDQWYEQAEDNHLEEIEQDVKESIKQLEDDREPITLNVVLIYMDKPLEDITEDDRAYIQDLIDDHTYEEQEDKTA